MKPIYLTLVFTVALNIVSAQSTPFILRGALKENRQQLYRNIVKNSIIKNLSLPLSDSTEEYWEDAFWAMELLNYRSAWAETKIYYAFDSIQSYSPAFQRALLELAFTNYRGRFLKSGSSLLLQTKEAKVFSMCAVYLDANMQTDGEKKFLLNQIQLKFDNDQNDPIIKELYFHLQYEQTKLPKTALCNLFNKDFLPGSVLLFSFQRKNRDYPGLVIIRDTAGNFVKNEDVFFAVPQLARSISNLPGFLTNGNTPEGIFSINGFDTSKSIFIGPTTNIQLSLPNEVKPDHFYNDSTSKNFFSIADYKKLLPDSLKNYFPLYEAYYAGLAGRNEIIAHGTTVDPSYYENKPYYPLTPTQGCLTTKEIWNDETGLLMASDQQKLVAAISKAGGPNGYAIVINIDDQQRPVELNEILEFLPGTNQK